MTSGPGPGVTTYRLPELERPPSNTGGVPLRRFGDQGPESFRAPLGKQRFGRLFGETGDGVELPAVPGKRMGLPVELAVEHAT